MNYDSLYATIALNIYENHLNQVTAKMVKAACDSIVASLGYGYQFRGAASPGDAGPGNIDQRVFYIASTPGTYSGFGGLTLAANEVALLKWDSAWSKETLDIPSKTQIMARLAAQDAQIAVQNGRLDGQDEEIADFEEAVQNQVDNYPRITIEGNVTNAPDEEDITSVEENGNRVLKFKNRSAFDGMGFVILRKGGSNTFANQVTAANTIYEIRYDFALDADFTMPSNCVLKFNGGRISGGHIICNNTVLIGNYKDSITNISGYFIQEDYLKSVGLSEDLTNFIVVKTGDELGAALSNNSPNYNTIFLMGDVFIISSTISVAFGGNIVPYPGYRPQIISGTDVVYKYEQDPDNEDYLVCDMPSMGAGRHFYLFNGVGDNVAVQKLSDILGSSPTAGGDITKDGDIIKIPMTNAVASVLSNKTQDELKYCVLMLNAGFTTVQLDKLYTDTQYIYGEVWQYEYWGAYYNYEKSSYGVNAPFEIYNVPIYGGGNAFIDGGKVLHISKDNAGCTLLGRSEVVFNISSSSQQLNFVGITFKGGGANSFFYGDNAANKTFVNCYFENILSCCSASGASSNIVFDSCSFRNIGGTCLYLRGQDHTIKNCIFDHIGLLKKRAMCIDFIGSDISVTQNSFIDFSYSALYTGNSDNNSCIIKQNVIEQKEFKENPAKYVLRDGGGIYVHEKNDRVIIAENLIKHIVCAPSISYTYDNRGIFLDNGACNVDAQYNTIFDVCSFAIDARYVSSKVFSSKNNSFIGNFLFGESRFEGNPNATDNEKIIANDNVIAEQFNIITNEYIQTNRNIFTSMYIENDILCSQFTYYRPSEFANALVKKVGYTAFVPKKSVKWIMPAGTSVFKRIYCPTFPNKQIDMASEGIVYAKYKVYLRTDYSEYPDIYYTLNVTFNSKNGRAALVDIGGLETRNTNRAFVRRATTQSISDANSSNKGFLLNLAITSDPVKATYCTITLESITSRADYLPCSTFLSVEDASQDDSIDVVKIPATAGSKNERPQFSAYLNGLYVGFKYYDKTFEIPIFWNGTKWVLADGSDAPTS